MSTRTTGRPPVTSHAAIEAVAFRLFAERGFEATTMDDIAAELGVGRRTLFRYYGSKNDIPWGQFDQTLENFRRILASMPTDIPLHEAIHRGVVAFNDFPADAQPSHRERMKLILETPALQAHSVLRYRQWRDVIAEYVADRLGTTSTALMPMAIGQASLAVALTAYEHWLPDEDASIRDLLNGAMAVLGRYFQGSDVAP